MLLQKFLLLLLLGLALLAGYGAHQFWKKKIDPRRSFQQFILFMMVNLLSVFVLVFIFGFIIIYFKEFFVKQ